MYPEGEDIPKEDIYKYKDVIKEYYIWCDKIIGDLLKIVDKDTIAIVISDHGFKKNNQIENQCFFTEVDHFLEVAGLKEFSHNSKAIRMENTQSFNWKHVKNIKILGDFPKEEFNTIREKAKDILKTIKVKETGHFIFEIPDDTNFGFLLKPDIVYMNQHPTHHLLINGREHKILDFLTRNPESGYHDGKRAVIIISGRGVRHNQKIMDASVYDIAPTVLYLLDLPVAADMDGRVLMRAFDSDTLDKKPVRYIDTYEENQEPISQKLIRSPADEAIIKERMRSLGYIN
jgi:predicted AlkP superfamily phosphohydrolase/phosphomutase